MQNSTTSASNLIQIRPAVLELNRQMDGLAMFGIINIRIQFRAEFIGVFVHYLCTQCFQTFGNYHHKIDIYIYNSLSCNNLFAINTQLLQLLTITLHSQKLIPHKTSGPYINGSVSSTPEVRKTAILRIPTFRKFKNEE